MIPNDRTKLPGGLSPAILLILGVVLTAAIILGIKFLMGNDSEGAPPPSAAKDAIFIRDDTDRNNAPGYNPAARPENPGGDSLSMFKKTNAGYAAEGSSAADEEQAGPEAAKKTSAVKKQAAKTAQKSQQRTVIPRMQGAKPFGSATPAKQGMPGGAGMPDISAIMKQAQQKPQTGD